MTRSLPARLSAQLVASAAAATILVACGSDDNNTSGRSAASPATGVLEGMEDGLARGSTEVVPYDASVQSGGDQSSLTSAAVVPFVDIEELVTVEVTPISVEEGSLKDLELDADAAKSAAGASVYYVRYRIGYVNGPVLAQTGAAWFELTSGDTVVTDRLSLFGGGGPCAPTYKVASFGKDAYLEGCHTLFVAKGSPSPDHLAWRAPAGPDNFDVQATWPLG